MHDFMNASTRMPALLVRYVAGQISEKTWHAFTDVIDTIEATFEERAALVDFFHDAMEELGLDAIKLPHQKEAESMVAAMRIAG